MTTSQTPSDGEHGNELLKLQSEYWHKRLDHTLQHTQAATKLIYMVDGAVLAFLYFLFKSVGFERPVVGIAAIPILLLASVSYFHAAFISRQQSWYNGIDAKLRDLLGQGVVKHTPKPYLLKSPESSHECYRLIHLSILLVLLIAGALMLIYGFGAFPDLPKPVNPVKP